MINAAVTNNFVKLNPSMAYLYKDRLRPVKACSPDTEEIRRE